MEIILDFVLTAGIVLTLLIIFFVIKARQKWELPQILLTLFFTVMVLYLLYHYAVLHDLNILRIITFNFNAVTPLFLGPVIYLYVKSIFTEQKHWLKNSFIHFIPSIIFIIFISTPMLISLTRGEMIFSYLEFIAEYRKEMFTLFDLVFVVYSIASLIIFLQYKRTLKLNYSTLSAREYEWINFLLIGTLVISSGHLILHIISFTQIEETFQRSYITIFSMVLLVTYLGYHGISQSRILLPHFLLNETKSKRQDLIIEEQDKQFLKDKLEELLLNDKVYLDHDLTLSKLADLIPVNNKKLSAFINQHLNTTFYDMINAYRVKAVKEKMNDKASQHLTLLGIAYDSGFNSKTSFNRIFKKETGFSPSDFKKQFK
ncbi:MAG: helix-turn-helix domain-containing protein [Bacteroidota bacterium]